MLGGRHADTGKLDVTLEMAACHLWGNNGSTHILHQAGGGEAGFSRGSEVCVGVGVGVGEG